MDPEGLLGYGRVLRPGPDTWARQAGLPAWCDGRPTVNARLPPRFWNARRISSLPPNLPRWTGGTGRQTDQSRCAGCMDDFPKQPILRPCDGESHVVAAVRPRN